MNIRNAYIITGCIKRPTTPGFIYFNFETRRFEIEKDGGGTFPYQFQAEDILANDWRSVES